MIWSRFNVPSSVLKQTVSKALVKSAKTINVTSLRLIACNRTSLKPINTVAVEWPLRNPPRLLVSINSTICFATTFSKTFDRAGRIEMGRNSSSDDGELFLGIGLILANFQICGNLEFAIQLLIITVSGSANCSAASLINWTGIWSGPVEQSDFSDLIVFRMSTRETVFNVNCSSIGTRSGRPSIIWFNWFDVVHSRSSKWYELEFQQKIYSVFPRQSEVAYNLASLFCE